LKIEWTDDELEVEKLGSEPPNDFVCPRKEQTEYFVEHAWGDQNVGLSVTYVLLFKGDLAGYVTVTMDEIPLNKVERGEGVRFGRVPAMKIAQMGVHEKYAGIGFGKYLVTYAIMVATQVKEAVGCRYVTLDAKTDLVDWYTKQGFVINDKDQEERVKEVEALHMRQVQKEKRLETLPVSMRQDLYEFELQ
jgi:GNAT superfamily N-acetyltransferase